MKTYLKHTALYISRAIIFQYTWKALTGRALDRKWEEQKQDIARRVVGEVVEAELGPRLALVCVDEIEARGKLEFPYDDGNVLVLGPECFIDQGRDVISWCGVNYYRNFHGDE